MPTPYASSTIKLREQAVLVIIRPERIYPKDVDLRWRYWRNHFPNSVYLGLTTGLFCSRDFAFSSKIQVSRRIKLFRRKIFKGSNSSTNQYSKLNVFSADGFPQILLQELAQGKKCIWLASHSSSFLPILFFLFINYYYQLKQALIHEGQFSLANFEDFFSKSYYSETSKQF